MFTKIVTYIAAVYNCFTDTVVLLLFLSLLLLLLLLLSSLVKSLALENNELFNTNKPTDP